MTSMKSSDKSFRFTFLRTMQKNWHFPVLISAVVSFLTYISGIVNDWVTYLDRNGAVTYDGLSFSQVYTERQNLLYILGSADMSNELFVGFMMLLAMATGIMIFRYMFSKKAVNVYYSLGISRKKMFVSKYLSGAFMLTLSVLVPLVIDIILNLIVFGSSKELWLTALFYFLGMFLSVLFAYTVSVAVCCRVGTIIEAIVYSGVFLLTPVFLTYIVHFLYKNLLYGSPIYQNDWINLRWQNLTYYGEGIGSNFDMNFEYNTVPFAKVFYFSNDVHSNLVDWRTPNFVSLIPLAILIVAVAVIALVTYKNRKTEIAGFLGCDELTKGLSVFIVSSVVSCGLIEIFIDYNHEIAVLCAILSLLIFLIVYLFFDIVTIHNVKGIIKSSWKYLVHVSVAAIIVAVFSTGLFGYSSRLPDFEDVESVAVSTGTGDVMMNYKELMSSKGYSGVSDLADYYLLVGFSQYTGIVDGFTDPNDIQYVLDIHEKFIECKNLKVNEETLNAGYGKRVLPVNINFIYQLKNGETLERVFPVATDEIMQMLAELTKTDRYKQLATEYIKKPVPGLKYNETFDEYFYESTQIEVMGNVVSESVAYSSLASERPFTFRGADVAIASPLFSNVTFIPDLTDDSEIKDDLLNAICADIENDTLPLNFRSNSEILGYIVFDNFVLDNEDYDDFRIREQGGSVISREKTEPYKINVFGGEFKACLSIRVSVPVYADMTNTLNFLKSNNLDSYLTEACGISKIRLWAPDEQSVAENTTYICASMLWGGWWLNTDETCFLIPENATSITDKNDIKKISSYCTMMCLACYENNYAEIIFEDGSRCFAAVPVK